MRPLVCSLLCMYIPLLIITFLKQMYNLFLLLCILILVGYKHHTKVYKDDKYHTSDKILCRVLILYTCILNIFKYKNRLYWICLLIVIMCYWGTFYCDYQEDCKRNWENIGEQIPHMTMHIAAGIGITSMIMFNEQKAIE